MRVPLYRLQGHGDHFYTTSATERDNAVNQFGYTIEGIACYVDDDPNEVAPAPVAPGPVETIIVPSTLELRDRFAMSAMASIQHGRWYAGLYVGDRAKQIPEDAAASYVIADAMLAART